MAPNDINKHTGLEHRHVPETIDGKTYEATVTTTSPHLDYHHNPTRPAFREFANPAPLGLCAFALTTFVLSLINMQARSVTTPNIVIGLGTTPPPSALFGIVLTTALGYGGLGQFVAGMWEMAVGNSFGALALTSYAGFWFSYAAVFIPSLNIAAAYKDNPSEFATAIAHYLMCTSPKTPSCPQSH